MRLQRARLLITMQANWPCTYSHISLYVIVMQRNELINIPLHGNPVMWQRSLHSFIYMASITLKQLFSLRDYSTHADLPPLNAWIRLKFPFEQNCSAVADTKIWTWKARLRTSGSDSFQGLSQHHEAHTNSQLYSMLLWYDISARASKRQDKRSDPIHD